MKTKTPAASKKIRTEPRIDCPLTTYSESALAMMEQATGQRFARSPVPVKAPVAAVDAE